MHDERIDEAFDLIHRAYTLLMLAHDDTDNGPVRYICAKCMTHLFDAGSALMNLVSKEN